MASWPMWLELKEATRSSTETLIVYGRGWVAWRGRWGRRRQIMGKTRKDPEEEGLKYSSRSSRIQISIRDPGPDRLPYAARTRRGWSPAAPALGVGLAPAGSDSPPRMLPARPQRPPRLTRPSSAHPRVAHAPSGARPHPQSAAGPVPHGGLSHQGNVSPKRRLVASCRRTRQRGLGEFQRERCHVLPRGRASHHPSTARRARCDGRERRRKRQRHRGGPARCKRTSAASPPDGDPPATGSRYVVA